MTEELQAGIDSMRDLIKDACITDIASASVHFFRELLDELDELRAQLAAAQAKIDAVPAEEMYFYMRHSCGWRIGTPEKVERYTQCERSIDRWLVAQPECDAWIKRVQP